jgi:carnitine 3-dehydrogenase
MTIRRITVVGGGVIGSSWTAFYLSKGFLVTVTDPAPDAENRLTKALITVLGDLYAKASAGLRFEGDLTPALAEADFIQENGPELLHLKRHLYEKMDDVLPSSVIIASSSSGIKMSDIQTACKKHPERCVIAHPFNPPHLIPLVEIVGGGATSADAIERARSFYNSLGKQTVVLKREMSGHVANRLAAALYREIYYLVAEDVISVEDVDKVISWGPGLRWGLMGQNLIYHLAGGKDGMSHFFEQFKLPMETWWQDLGSPMMTDETNQKIIAGSVAAQRGKTLEEIANERDKLLTALIQAREKSFLP